MADENGKTPLDAAHAAMEAAPETDTAARLAFYDVLSASELFVLLADEGDGDSVTPEIFETGGQRYVLAFDREARLTAFTGRASPYAALSGRAVAGMLAGEGLGLALNPGVAPSAFVMPPDAVAWLAETVARAPGEIEARARSFHAPTDLPETLLTTLDARLAAAAGLARTACLVAVAYDDGTQGHMLAFVAAQPGAEGALARLVGEAVAFSGMEDGALDVGFFEPDAPVTERLARVGLRFDLPAARAMPDQPPGAAPGMDPAKPPRLR
ncbi:MAG: SseB family protein [Roseovarius sp.]|nr:SseB family protein [Roseovarius sp.]